MIDSKKLYDIFFTTTRVVLSFLILQFLNIVLFFIGFGILFIPLIFLVNTICIQKILFEKTFFNFKEYLVLIKKNVLKSFGILIISVILFVGINSNISLMSYIVSNNLNLFYYYISVVIIIFLIIISLGFFLYVPLVNATDDLTFIQLIKVSLIIPFVKLKVSLILILMVIFSTIITTNNVLFFVLIGPNLLIACNIVVYKYYLKEKK